MNGIKWKVENCNVHTVDSTSLPFMEVDLVGFITNYGAYKSHRIPEILEDIEHRLNEDRRRPTGISRPFVDPMEIKKVIFNPPATIVFWADGTKTVVKDQGEGFDPEKGLAMAISKKALGNQGNYYNHFKKWTEKYYESRETFYARDSWSATLEKIKEVILPKAKLNLREKFDDETKTIIDEEGRRQKKEIVAKIDKIISSNEHCSKLIGCDGCAYSGVIPCSTVRTIDTNEVLIECRKLLSKE